MGAAGAALDSSTGATDASPKAASGAPVDPGGFRWRVVQCLIMFVAACVGLTMRSCLSVAVVAMTRKDTHGEEHFDWTPAEKSTVLGSFLWGYMASQVAGGTLSTRWRASLLCGASISVSGVITALLPLVVGPGGVPAVAAIRVLTGVIQGSMYPSMYTLIGRWVPPDERSRTGALLLGWWATSLGLGPAPAFSPWVPPAADVTISLPTLSSDLWRSSSTNAAAGGAAASYPNTVHGSRADYSARPFACDVCRRRFVRSRSLEKHRERHGARQAAAGTPHVAAKTPSHPIKKNLTVAVDRASRQRPFGCDVCDKRFLQSFHLTEHRRIHTGERPFACAQCGRRFTQSGSLTNHLRVHAGMRCSNCGKEFAQRARLARHQGRCGCGLQTAPGTASAGLDQPASNFEKSPPITVTGMGSETLFGIRRGDFDVFGTSIIDSPSTLQPARTEHEATKTIG